MGLVRRLLKRLLGLAVTTAVVLCSLLAHESGYTWRLKGGLSRFCFDLLDFEYDNGGGIYLTKPFLTTYWVRACESVFPELDKQQQVLIDSLFDKPLPQKVLFSAMQRARKGQAEPVVPNSTKEELRKSILQSKPRESAPVGHDAENLTRMVKEHAGGMHLDWLDHHKFFAVLGRPAQEPVVEPSEVGEALKEGRLVKFDATKILPKKTFNVTLDILSQLHGSEGDAISILAFLHGSKRCREGAYHSRKRFPVGAIFCNPTPTLGETRKQFPNNKRMPDSSRIALRRLPMYINEATMLEKLGLEGVERPEGQIIMGHAMGDTHWDEQDNIFIQASGVGVVFGVPAEYTDAIAGGEKSSAKSSGQLWHEWLLADGLRSSIPWYYMVMKPGDGIAIPSRAFHAVYGGHNRASLQTFLEPRFRGMRWKTNKHSYWHKETETRQAVRNMYFKTAGRLWDTRGIGMISQGAVIEYL
mmetsp:Transcript_66125/g.132696  ORF Transcript_66125/g.132696 Transcript_66125/m.132696 type:complete len:471 (+) Transcript_66125:77-1489(+)